MGQDPDYLIIGSMKCGTTALQDFICLHPDVCRPKQKEIHYFSLYFYKSIAWYLNFFSDEPKKVTGEASPTYFDVANTGLIPRAIKEFNKDIKLILILRDPVIRAISHFHHLKLVMKVPELLEMDAEDFFSRPLEDAWSESTAVNHYVKQCIDFSLYLPKYMLYRQLFKENMIVIHNDDLLKKPEDVMNRIFRFLNLDDYYSPEFKSFIYSANTKMEDLSNETCQKLSSLLSPGWNRIKEIEGFI